MDRRPPWFARITGRNRAGRPARRPLPPGFTAIWVTVAVDLVGFGIVLPILPRYAEDLHVSPTVIGLVVGSFSLAQMVFAPVLGRLSDRIGRKPVLLLSLAGTALGSLLTGLAGAVWLLLLGRVLDGASGASVSVAQAAVTDVASAEDRPRLLGLLGAAFGVGFVVGPAIGTLAALGGPHIPFFVAAAIAAVNAVGAIRRLPETLPVALAREERRRSRLGDRASLEPAPLFGAPADDPARNVMAYAVEPGPVTAGAGGEAKGGLAALDPPAMSGGVRRLVAVTFLGLLAFGGFEATFSLLLHDRFAFTLSTTGAIFTVIGILLVAVQGGLVHSVARRLGEVGGLRLGLAVEAAGLGLLAVDGGAWSAVPAVALLVLGQGLVTPTAASALAGVARSRHRGRVLGFQQSAGSLARFVGPFGAGALYQHVAVPSPYVVGAGLLVAALSVTAGLARFAPGGGRA